MVVWEGCEGPAKYADACGRLSCPVRYPVSLRPCCCIVVSCKDIGLIIIMSFTPLFLCCCCCRMASCCPLTSALPSTPSPSSSSFNSFFSLRCVCASSIFRIAHIHTHSHIHNRRLCCVFSLSLSLSPSSAKAPVLTSSVYLISPLCKAPIFFRWCFCLSLLSPPLFSFCTVSCSLSPNTLTHNVAADQHLALPSFPLSLSLSAATAPRGGDAYHNIDHSFYS